MEKTMSIDAIYRKLKLIEDSMVTKKELNSMMETVMVLSNDETMNQIMESEENIKNGKIKKINSASDI